MHIKPLLTSIFSSGILTFGFILTLTLTLTNTAQAQNITVMELFTTQGCSSCPPADKIFDKYATNAPENLIALSCHVTYFDGSAWQDPLSNTFCDARHQGYYKALSLNALYTPQMIINGKFDTKGNKDKIVSAGVRMGMSLNSIRRIQVSMRQDYLDITLPKMRLQKPVDVWLLAYNKNHRTIITAGQNKGEDINYPNAVNNLTKLMRWDGSYLNMAFPIGHMDSDGYVILAQYADHTEIVAAGKVEE